MGSAVIEIAAVAFEPISGGKVRNGDAFSAAVAYQDGLGGVDHGVLAAMIGDKRFSGLSVALREEAGLAGSVLEAFTAWPSQALGISWEAVGGVWAEDAVGTLGDLRRLFEVHSRPVPWGERVERSADTIYSLTGGEPTVDTSGLDLCRALSGAEIMIARIQTAHRNAGA